MTEPRLPSTWHLALAYAMTGRRLDGLDEAGGLDGPGAVDAAGAVEAHGRLDLPTLARTLLELQNAGRVVIASSVAERHDPPAELRAGIGPAQFWAALSELATMLNPNPSARSSPVVAERPLTPEERRLTDDTPPHHGS
jgi:hypothetical protein